MATKLKRLGAVTGATLFEVLIALALTGVVTAAVFQAYVVQHEHYLAQDNITQVQQNARATLDEMSRHIRMAGHRTPGGVAAISGSNSNPDTLTVVYREGNCETSLNAKMTSTTDVLSCGSALDCFESGTWVYIFHPDSGGAEWFQILDINVTDSAMSSAYALSRAYPAGAVIIPLTLVRFYVDYSNPDEPSLMRVNQGGAPQVFAENITDVQFRYHLASGDTTDVPLLITDVEEVLITVTGKSPERDHTRSGSPFRYRSYESSVSLRNL